ncbi:serpin family protein [Candidatus Woesearchaeota archaeon]|nr:MAG: serpin family protein [Candidatus Woesearchaeota archaeon]
MNRKILTSGIIVIIIALVVFISSCVKEPAVKVDDTGWTLEGVNTVVNANNQFAFDLYSQFKEESKDENIFFSPYSISVALTMTYEGARGKTAEEMQSVLHIPENANLRRANFAKIINEINKEDKKYKLHTANALWPRIDFRLLEEYQNTIDTYYGGKVTRLDYAREAEKSRQIINSWVEDKTEDKIKDLIPPGILNPDTVLVLTNAIYFKGTWVLQFDPKDTRDEDFTTSAGQTVKVPMMRLTGEDAEFNYVETDEVQILEMPYEGEDLSMLIILPKENNLEKIEESITPEKLSEWKNILKKQRVDIFIPKFKFETKYFMVDTLKKMGMVSAFNAPPADFSGMDGTKNLKIQNVIHQAFVEVNEEGTEIAAATAVIVGRESVQITPVFRADHPFIFIIQQKDTGNILFLGRVSDPTK